ncbi:MAG: protein kinase family protein [Candidatus Paceibacterota bacterium]
MYFQNFVQLSKKKNGTLDDKKNIIEHDGDTYILRFLNSETDQQKGGNSSVYELVDPNGNLPNSAIKISKVYKPYRTANKKIKRRYGRFINEIDALKKAKEIGLNHVVEIIFDGIIEIQGKTFPYFVMEKADTDLGSFLINNELDEQERVFFMVQIFDAIQQLHSLGIYHRDIKPDNIFVFYQNEEESEESKFVWKIGDLGLIKLREKEFDGVGEKIGPFGFISPEVMNKVLTEKKKIGFDCNIDGSSDVFQLGLLFWFIIQNNVPLGQITKDDFIADIKNKESFFKIIFQMLQHSKDRRISMDDLEDELSGIKKEYVI